MKKSINIIFWNLLIIFCYPLHFNSIAETQFPPPVPKEAWEVAQEQLNLLKEKLRDPEKKKFYGLQENDLPEKLTLDEPFPSFYLEGCQILNYQPGQSLKTLLATNSYWFHFPTLIGTNYKTIMKIRQKPNGSWVWSSSLLGVSEYYIELRQAWPFSKGYHPVLVEVEEMKQSFYTIPELDFYNLTPIATHSFHMNQNSSSGDKKLWHLFTTLHQIRPKIEEFKRMLELYPGTNFFGG